jgi:hypothetical protein
VVGIVIGYGLDDRGVGVPVPVGSRISNFIYRPDRLWFQGHFTRGCSGKGGGVNLTTHLQLVPRSRKLGSIHSLLYTSPWCST